MNVADHAFGRATQEKAARGGFSVRAHQNQIRLAVFSDLNDLARCRAERQYVLTRDLFSLCLQEVLQGPLCRREDAVSDQLQLTDERHLPVRIGNNLDHMNADELRLETPREADRVAESLAGGVRKIDGYQNALY